MDKPSELVDLTGVLFRYSSGLTRTGQNYYDSRKGLPEGYLISSAEHEWRIQKPIEDAGDDPREAEAFNDLFGRNPEEWYAWQWTDTGLRVPKGRKADKYETDKHGNNRWPRIRLVGRDEKDTLWIPEGNNRIVTEWYDNGIPKTTTDKSIPYNEHTTHFRFNPTPSKDPITGEYDVGVARGGDWHHVGRVRCLGVDAFYGRWGAVDYGGVRLVQGSLPNIERLASASPGDVTSACLEEIRRDYKELPPQKFQEKYGL